MTKRFLNALEKIFEREIEGALLHSHAKVYDELAALGYCERESRKLGADRFGEIVIDGWALTHSGRFAYCDWASNGTYKTNNQ